MIEVAYVFVDLGNEVLKTCVHEFVQSVRRHMPDARITQISDRDTPLYPDAHGLIEVNTVCKLDQMAAFKGYFTADYAATCENPLVLCDADLILNRSLEPVFEWLSEEQPIGLVPVEDDFETSLMFSSGTQQAKQWWSQYQREISRLSDHGMDNWGCDAIALRLCALRNPLIKELDDALYVEQCTHKPLLKSSAYATHFPSATRRFLTDYAKVA